MAEKQQMYRVVNPNQDLQYEKRQEEIRKDPESRQYLICIKATPQSSMPDEWEIVTGRSEAREMIIDAIDYIDFEHSFVLVESCVLADRKSIYTFMKHIEQFFNDGFDIDSYIKGDWSEDDYIKRNEIDTSIYNPANTSRSVSMEEIMNGSIDIQSLNSGKED